jgi:hypothetical protein
VRRSLCGHLSIPVFSFRLSVEQFLENEDVTHLYILAQPSSQLHALNSIPVDFNAYERAVLFLKTNLTTKLTRENLGACLIFSR